MRDPQPCPTTAGFPGAAPRVPEELGSRARPRGGAEEIGAHVFVAFLSVESGRAFAEALAGCPGDPTLSDEESVRFARERFRPQQAKRLGPGFLAAEILLPAANVAAFLPAAERLARKCGLELDAEVYYLSDGLALAIAGFLADHRSGKFYVDLLLAPMLLDLAMARFGARPYVLGRLQATLAGRKFGSDVLHHLLSLKRSLDPGSVVNRGAFFEMGLRGLFGALVAWTMGPGLRLLRLVTEGVPWLAASARRLLGAFGGPAVGRGLAAAESPLGDGSAPEPRNATGRAIGCVNCGECNSVCPIFNESKVRLPQMLTHLGEGLHAGDDPGVSGSTLLDLCVRCGNCEEVCQAGIPHLPLYAVMQRAADASGAPDRERQVLLLERLRASGAYLQGFLDVRPGGYLQRAPVALPGSARFVLLRAENDAGPAATCIHCAACVDVCPTGANEEYRARDPRWITTDQERCIGCGTCVEVCPANLVNGGQTLRVMEAPTLDWLAAAAEFAAGEGR